MALVLANRVQETATPNTTVSFTLTGAVSGFQTFAVIGNTNTTYYSATDSSGNWEVGLGTYSTSGPTLTRTTIYASSNSGSAVTFSGAVNVFVTYPSGKSVNLDGSGNVSALGTVSSGTWQGTTVGVAYGGTGVTTSSGPNSVVLRDVNENITVNRLSQGLQTITASGVVTILTAASDFNQQLVGTGGHTFRLPDATTLTDTTTFQFNNNATGTLTIQNNAATTVGAVAPGGAAGIALMNNSTSGGTWDVHGYIPENVIWGTNSLYLASDVITGGTWQGGTIQSAYGGTGLTTFTGANNALYSTSASNLVAGTLPAAAGGTGLTSFTANGVVYANATNTLTTGSALTYDGNTLKNDTASTTAPNVRIENGSFNRVGTVALTANGVQFDAFDQSSTSTQRSFMWLSGGSEQMRLTSTGLGIGTNSPAYKIDVNGVANFAAGVIHRVGAQPMFTQSSDATVSFLYTGSSAMSWRNQANSTELMRLDASGNLGIGTTPGTTLDVYKATGNSIIRAWAASGIPRFDLRSATRYYSVSIQSDNLTFFDETAGSTRMTLVSSGNLGIGTSSPGRKLSVSNGGAQGFEFGPGVGLSSGNELLNYNRATSQYVPSQVYASTHTFYTGTSGGTLGVVFDGSSLGVGITPSYKLHVAGASGSELRWENTDDINRGWRIKATTGVGVNFGTTSGVYPLLFDIDSVTKMTLDTSGNLSMAAGGAIVSSRINPRTSTTTSTTTLTPDIQAADQYNLTAQAVGLTVAAPTGTPVDGNKLLFRILDNGSAQTITWNGTYTVIGTTLPTTTTASKMLYVGCIYNSTNTRWDVVAVTTQA